MRRRFPLQAKKLQLQVKKQKAPKHNCKQRSSFVRRKLPTVSKKPHPNRTHQILANRVTRFWGSKAQTLHFTVHHRESQQSVPISSAWRAWFWTTPWVNFIGPALSTRPCCNKKPLGRQQRHWPSTSQQYDIHFYHQIVHYVDYPTVGYSGSGEMFSGIDFRKLLILLRDRPLS